MLADPPSSLYLLMIVAAIVSGGVWAKYQSRKTLLVFLAALVLVWGLYLFDLLVESPREEATRRVIAMAKAAEAGNEREFMTHVSPKAQFDRPIPWSLIHQYKPRIAVWDLSRDDYTMFKSDANLKVGFMAKGEAPGGIVLKYVEGFFERQPDGSWKLDRVQFYNPATKQPEPLP